MLENENNEVEEQVVPDGEAAAVEVPEVENAEEAIEAPVTGSAESPEVAAYEPNFKYTANDEEREFDERVRAAIKSKEDEEWLREVFTKADGFEAMKSLREEKINKARERYEELEKSYTQITQNIEPLTHMLEKKDFDNLIPALGITEDELIAHAYKLAQLKELTPQEQMQYNQTKELRTREYELQRNNEALRTQLEQQSVQQRQAEMNDALNTPDVQDIVKQFDQRNGQNAFFREVAQRGALYHQSQGIDKRPAELVNEIITAYGLAPQPTQQAPAQPIQQSKPKEALPVIPNTGGSGASTPIKRKPQSLAEIKAMIGKS